MTKPNPDDYFGDSKGEATAKPKGKRSINPDDYFGPIEPPKPKAEKPPGLIKRGLAALANGRGVDEVDAGGGTAPVLQDGQTPNAAPQSSALDRSQYSSSGRMLEEAMLTPEFVQSVRDGFGKIPPEKRMDALREQAVGSSSKAMAARIILRDAEAENRRADTVRQQSSGMVDGLERAMAAPRVPFKAGSGAAPVAPVDFPEAGAIPQYLQGRDAAGVASRHAAARAVDTDQRSIDALTQREQAAASDSDAKAFAAENPMTSAVASGAAGMLRGLDNIVPTVLDFASNLVGAKTSGVKNQSETSAWLERKARNLMPEAGQQEMGAAWHKGEFGNWLMLNLAATAPQLAPTLVAAFVPGAQPAALGLLGGIAAGNKYADTGNSAAAVASGLVEGFSERLPLKYFERSAKALSTLPPAIRGKTVQAIGKALPIVGKHLTAQGIVGAIEEVVAQIGNNAIDATILEKDNSLLDGVAEAAVIGAFASGGLSIPQAAGALRQAAQSPEQHIAQAIDQAAAQFGLNPKAAATLREKIAGMDPDAATNYAEKVFAAAERAGFVKKPGGGTAVRQNLKDLAEKAAKDAEAQQGDASGDSAPAGAAASSDTGLADELDAGAILGTQAEAPQATSGEAPTEGATDGPMKDDPAQPGVEAGAAPPIEGEPINKAWSAFTPESGTLNIPREQMPQVDAEHRGALVQFLGARGITHESAEVPADSLKPTQAEFSPKKVEHFAGNPSGRSILVSQDGYVLDGHHQWMAKRAAGEPVKVIRLNAPIQDLLRLTHQFPSSTTSKGPRNVVSGNGAGPDSGRSAQPGPADAGDGRGTGALVPGELQQPGAAGTAGGAVPDAGPRDVPGADRPGDGNEALKEDHSDESQGQARHERNARTARMDQRQAPLQQLEDSGVSSVRGEGHQDEPSLGERLRSVSPGGRAAAEPAALAGSDRQQQGVRAGQREVGDGRATGPEHSDLPEDHAPRSNANDVGVGKGTQPASTHDPRPAKKGMADFSSSLAGEASKRFATAGTDLSGQSDVTRSVGARGRSDSRDIAPTTETGLERGARADGTFAAGDAVTLGSQRYAVASASPKAIRLTGQDGKVRVITSDSANWAKVKPAETRQEPGKNPATAGAIAEEFAGQMGEGMAEHVAKVQQRRLSRERPELEWTVAEADPTRNPKLKADRYVVQGRAPVAQAQPDQEGAPAGGVEPAGAAAAPAVPAAGSAPVEADGVSPLATAKVGDTVDVVHRDSNGDLRVAGTVLSVEDAGVWIKESDGRRRINRSDFGNWIKAGTEEKKTDNYGTWTAYEGADPAYVTVIGERDGEFEIDDGYTTQWVPKSQVEQAGKAAADPFESEKLNLIRIKEISDRQGMALHTDHMRSDGLAATGWSAEAAESAANAMVPPVVRGMADAAQDSVDGMRKRITDVRLADTDGQSNAITFAFDGAPYRGILKGRNADLAVAGDGRESDRGIAVRVMLDGDAAPTKAAPKEGDFIRLATNAERMMSAARRDGIAGNLGGVYLAKGSRGAGFYKRPAATPKAEAPASTQAPAAPAVVPGTTSPRVEADGVKPTSPVIQNRDRSTPAAITQMRGIAGNPDYLRLSSSRDFTAGAPVIVGSIPLAQMGRKETMAAGKRRIPGVYAVVEAAELVASNSVDGSANPAFEKAATKVIAGNGRTAGLQEAYRTGKAGNYRAELEADESHGINPDVIRGMKAPVLVRVMPASEITDDIGDISNTQAGLQLSAVEQARNDANRVNLDALEFTEDGRITPDTVRRFVQAMPQAEQGNLINRDGSPTAQAVDRLNAVVFFKAYNSEPLTNLYAQTADPDARNIMSALAQAATSMARLEGAGALDIRPLIAEAAEIAINGRRNGLKLSEIAAQDRLDADPDTRVILNLFASNANKVKPVAEALKRAADFAYSEANKPADDMFGSVSQAGRGDVVSQIGPRDEARGAQNLEEPAGGKPAGRNAEGQSPEGPGQGNAGAAEEGASAGQAEGLTLKAESEADAQAKAKREADALAAEKKAKADEQTRLEREAADKEARARADSSVDDFQLGQSADAQLSGQKDIFSAPEPTRIEDGDSEAIRQAKADLMASMGDLANLLGKNTRLNILPEQEQALMPVLARAFDAAFRLGHLKFKAAARFVLNTIRTMIGDDAADSITLDHLQGAYISMAGKYKDRGAEKAAVVASVETLDEITSQADAGSEANDVPSTNPNLERDRGNAAAPETPVAPPVQGDGSAGGAGAAGGQTGGGRGGRADGAGVPAGRPAAGRESGDQPVHREDREDRPSLFDAGTDNGERSDDPGIPGVPPESVAADQVEAVAVGRRDAVAARLAQSAAESIPVKPGDLDNIRATLPYLLPEQQEDVFKAEQRFAKDDGYGMLFTNGTGTGKTFTGLGIVKRFERQGKTNTLILVPDAKIMADWVDSGRALGLTITPLVDTKDKGKGVTITTYANLGSNDELAKREWDLVVPDEAHSLMQAADGKDTLALDALRAITWHPRGASTRFTMLNRADIDERKRLSDQITANDKIRNLDDTMDAVRDSLGAENLKLHAKWAALNKKLEAINEAMKAAYPSHQGAARARVAALSATPFAYETTVDWAEGLLFDYAEGYPAEYVNNSRYNTPSPHDYFFIQHFGWHMKTGKLNQPDAKVDRGLMQRQFNGWLKKRGVLSGRQLEVDADYDRKFILAESAVGNEIDRAIDWLDERRREGDEANTEARKEKRDESHNGYALLSGELSDRFYGPQGHLVRRYLLEAIKAKEVIPHVRAHLALGRKVVVWHDFKKGGSINPFDFRQKTAPAPGSDVVDNPALRAAYNNAAAAFRKEFPDLAGGALLENLISPIQRFTNEFPDVLLINGDEKPADLLARYKRFNDDSVGPVVALVQSAKNKGWSGHDTTGKHQRVQFNLGLPTQPTMTIQQEGRTYRTGQVSDAMFRYLNTGTNWEKWAFASTIATRASAAENLASGELARALKDAFITGFEESGDYPAGHEGEGKGGKERDRAANGAITEYDRAKTFYFGTQKKNSKTKAQEGKDYFATPEPVGLKMVQWLGLRGGEDGLEPSAGHGAIARWLGETVTRTAIEPSNALGARLAMVFDGKIIRDTFENLNVVNKFDGIAMNPPFGTAGRTAIDHVAKAATHLRDGGRIAALIPTGPAADKKFEKWFYEEDTRPVKPVAVVDIGMGEEGIFVGDMIKSHQSWQDGRVLGKTANGALRVKTGAPGETLVPESSVRAIARTGPRTESFRPADGLHLIADIKLPSVTFERAGTQVATRIVVIEKAGKGYDTPPQITRDYSDITEIGELFDRLEDLNLAPRAKPPEEVPASPREQRAEAEAEKKAKAQSGAAAAQETGLPVVEHTTSKGKVIRGVIRKDLSQPQAKEIDAYTWRKDGGYFIRLEHMAAMMEKYPPAGATPLLSQAPQSPEDAALQALSQDDELFQLPKSERGTIEGIAEENDAAIKVRKLVLQNRETMWTLTLPSGRQARITQRPADTYGPPIYGYESDGVSFTPVLERPGNNPDEVPDNNGDVWIDVSDLKEGDRGSLVYNIAATYAHNTGRIFIGDPNGVSDIALRRRAQHMLSSALKFGTTEHLAPSMEQERGSKAAGVPALNWTYGDDLGNIRSLINVALGGIDNAGGNPIDFRADTGRFYDQAGRELDDSALRSTVQDGRTPEARAGYSTLKSAAVLRTLLRAEGSGVRGQDGKSVGLLERLLAVRREHAGSTDGILYSQRGLGQTAASTTGTDPRALKTMVENIRRGWADAPPVTVVATTNDLPAPIVSQLRSMNAFGNVRALVMPDTGQVYLIADRLLTLADAQFALFHEVLGHYGLRKFLGTDYEKTMRQMRAMNAGLAAESRSWMAAYGPGQIEARVKRGMSYAEATVEVDLLSVEEALADRAGNPEPISGFKRLVAKLQAWLRDHGFMEVAKWLEGKTQAQVLSLLQSARDAVEKAEGVHAYTGGAMVAASQMDQTETPEFRKWFGDSKVVDAEGKPLRVYHGTKAEFTEFKRTKSGEFGPAIYLTDSPREAGEYGDGKGWGGPSGTAVMPVYASIQKPYTEGVDAFWKEFGRSDSDSAAVDRARAAGYDGIIAKRADRYYDNDAREFVDRGDTLTHFIVFDPTQIKSAIGNSGAFDPGNPSILLSQHTPEQRDALKRAGIAPKRRMKDNIRSAWEAAAGLIADRTDLAQSARQAVLDQFYGIQRAIQRDVGNLPLEQDPYVTARLANGGTSSVMRALLLHGQAQWAANGQHLEKKPGTVGLLDILKPLGDDLNDWFGWMIGNRAARLFSEGRENNFTEDQIKALQALATPEKIVAFRKAAVQYAAFKRSVLDVAEAAGLINKETRPAWDNADYIPFYRQIDERATFSATGKKGLAGQSSGIRTLKGGESALHDPIENLLMNFSRLIDASLKNNALSRTVRVLENAKSTALSKTGYTMSAEIVPRSQIEKALADAGTPDYILAGLPPEAFEGMAKMWAIQPPTDPSVIRIMRGGKPQFYKVHDPLLLKAATSFVPFDFPGLGVMRAFKRVLTAMVTSTPEFMLRNFIRDSAAVQGIARTGVNPAKSLSGIVRAFKEDGAAEHMLFAGASFQSGNTNAADPTGTATSIRRALRQKGMDAAAIDGFMATIVDKPARLWELYKHMGEAIENANREAIFEATAKKGSVTAAAYEAKDLMDFSLRGSNPLYQLAADVLPFFNARVQGLYRVGRSNPARLAVYAGIMAALSVALVMANSGEDWYDELPDWDKDAYWHFMIGGTHFRIPKPFELGVAFATIPERIARYLDGQDSGSKTVGRLFANVRDQLAFDPIPQAIRPAMNVWANKDTFRGSPIENIADEGKMPHQRYSATTSETARLVTDTLAPATDAIGLSPKKLEYLIGGYLGTVGTYALGATDMVVRELQDAPPQPAPRLDDLPIVKAFVREAPARTTVYENDLYAVREHIEQVYRSASALAKEGKTKEARAMLKEYAPEIKARGTVLGAAATLAGIRREREKVYADRAMTPEAKRKRLDELQVDENKAVKKAMTNPKVKALQ